MFQAPLPPGWEARYDANSARYYYINHQTKQTTWVDPRGARPQPPQQPQQQTSSYSFHQQSANSSVQFNTTSTTSTSQNFQTWGHTQGTTIPEDVDMNSSEESSSEGSEEEMPGMPDDDEYQVTDSEKVELVKKVKKALSLEGVSDELILMTLDGVFYDADMAIQVFQSMGFRKKGEVVQVSSSSEDRWETTTSRPTKTTAKTTSHSSTATTRTQPIPSATRISAQPQPTTSFAASADMSYGKEISFGDLNSKFGSGAESALFKSMKPDKSSDVLGKMRSAADSSVQAMFSKSRQTTSSINLTPSTSTMSTVATSTFKMMGKLQTVGANKGHACGSDATLLRGGHVVTKGSDRSLYVGAKRELAKGPSKAASGDRVKAKGADKSLRVGRNPGLAKGPVRGS